MKKKSLVEQVPLALFMGLIVGGATAFFFIQMPMVLIEQAVIASGLPTVIAAAGPPLGSTARVLVAGSAALGAGGFTWLAITLVGMIGRPRRARPVAEAADVFVPVETYPEAPLRRPIFAHADFGDPAPAPEMVPQPKEPIILAETKAEEVVLAEWAEVIDAEPVELMPVSEEPLELIDILPPEAPAPAPLRRHSIAELMARLEAGAERRATRFAKTRPVPAPPAPDFDGALRSALNELKQMAVR